MRRCWKPRSYWTSSVLGARDQIVKLEGELKKKYGDAAPPSVLGNKTVPVSQPVAAKKKSKWKKA